ncbi:bacteriohemerythrin [Azospirillum halopraeferens]|uniref:bacteriohemerythrin n=1 Tax=Azospirillum halopraeferens TaxID=34010 RepID=UPI00040B7F49|nr:bacteriohemerythrin [Azospirillum halopraeferens]
MDWDDAYAIGQRGVDDDHRHLFELFNRFSDAVSRGEAAAVVGGFLHDLVDYSEHHFHREEALMRARGYPDYEKHKAMHDTFATYVRRMATDAEHRGDEVMFLQNYVEMWLCGHILVMDKWLGEWLDERAAESAAGRPT